MPAEGRLWPSGDDEDGDVEDDRDDEDGKDEDGDDDHLLHHVASSQKARVETPGDHGLWVRLDKAVQGDLDLQQV